MSSVFVEVPCAAGKIVADVEITSWGYPSNGWDDPGEGMEYYINEAWIESILPHLERPLTNQECQELDEREDYHTAVGECHADDDNPYL